MLSSSTYRHRHRDVAMPDNGCTPGDSVRGRDRDYRGMNITSSRRPLSPLASAAAPPATGRGSGDRDKANDTDRNQRQGDKSRGRSPDRPSTDHHRRRKSRERSRDRPNPTSEAFIRHHPPGQGSGPRGRTQDREAVPLADLRRPPPHQDNARPITNPDRPPIKPRSPHSIKRLRSRSPPGGGSQSKRPRQDPSPRRPAKDFDSARLPPNSHRAPSPPRRDQSPSRRERRAKQRKAKGRGKPPGPPRRGRSRSPRREPDFSRNPNFQPLNRTESSRRDLSLTSYENRPRRSPSRPRSPPRRGGRRPTFSDTGSRERRTRTPEYDRDRHDYPHPPPRSPRERRGQGPSRKGRRRDDSRRREGPGEPVSGANSIEVNMAGRGGFRGGYGGQVQAGYPKGQFNSQSPHPNDPRAYSHSSGHATPNLSFHGTPPAQSPFGGSRGSWAGQQQFSPQNQYPPQFPQGAYPPTGPASHYQGSQPANSPPFGTPTGPSQPYSQGPYRGGYRNASGGSYRGNGVGPSRGGNRAGFKSGQWGPGGQGGSRGQSSQPDETASGRGTPRAASISAEQAATDGIVVAEEADNPFRPSKELQVEDTSKSEKNEDDALSRVGKPPPTGPQADKKISFALKSTSKAPATAAKFEISSKFNPAPPKRDLFQEAGRRDARDTKDSRDSRDARGSRDGRDARDGRDLPHNVPTEPASSRAAKAEQQKRQEQPPRVRKVKKIMKRLKPRPSLPDDLAGSDSVFFRKPGNESVIGSGTYGKVFKALHVYTKRLVALKKIRMEGERDGFPVTAVREIKLLQSLRHINIVSLQEVMVEKNDCFMVFEYMSHDLTGILNHPTFKLDAAQRKHLSKQLFEGLDYLHRRGVLHRDIKAANILVSADGILKIADFGLARFYAKRHQLDYTNRVITIWYRSPELLLGETQYGPAVDIWSAACVMVEIFTTRAIFPGDGGEISQLDKIYAILGTPHKSDWPGLVDMPWFELLRPGLRKPNVFEQRYKDKLPAAGYDLLAAMLQYDPGKRPSAADVLEHPYFTTEAPSPRQAVELQDIEGDWHEFESKALRKENEKKEKEAKRAAERGQTGREHTTTVPREGNAAPRDSNKDRKRPPDETNPSNREHKRQHVEKQAPQPEQRAQKAPPTAAAPVVPSSEA